MNQSKERDVSEVLCTCSERGCEKAGGIALLRSTIPGAASLAQAGSLYMQKRTQAKCAAKVGVKGKEVEGKEITRLQPVNDWRWPTHWRSQMGGEGGEKVSA